MYTNTLGMVLAMIGTMEILLICVVVLLLFGGKKIPELMRGLGQGVRSFKQGMNEPAKEDHKGTPDPNEVKMPEPEEKKD